MTIKRGFISCCSSKCGNNVTSIALGTSIKLYKSRCACQIHISTKYLAYILACDCLINNPWHLSCPFQLPTFWAKLYNDVAVSRTSTNK